MIKKGKKLSYITFYPSFIYNSQRKVYQDQAGIPPVLIYCAKNYFNNRHPYMMLNSQYTCPQLLIVAVQFFVASNVAG